MKGTIAILLLIGGALSKPQGYFREHFQYKSTSSAFKDNELTHKNDDEGYYGRHGDLEGRSEPKVNSYSQHSEYVNPKYKYGQSQGYQNDDFYTRQTAGQGSGSSSQYGSGYGTGQAGYGTSQAGYGTGQSGYGTGQAGYGTGQAGYGANQYGSSSSGIKTSGSSSSYSGGYSFGSGTGGGSSLYPTRELEVLMQQLQNDLSRQVQTVLDEENRRQQSSSYYSSSSAQLEQQLRNNLTQEFQGYQNNYGSNSQLDQLRQQLEADLIRQLQEGLRTQSLSASRSSSSSASSSFSTGYTGSAGYTGNSGYTGSTGQTGSSGTDFYNAHRTDGSSQPTHITPGSGSPGFGGSQTSHGTSGSQTSYGSYGTSSSHSQPSYGTSYVPTAPVRPLSEVTQQVERIVNVEIDKAVEATFEKHRKTHGYPDYQRELTELTNELQRNLTREWDSQLSKYYGRQELRGAYYYTVGQQSANYAQTELSNAKQQLLNKLDRELQEKFRTQYTQYTQTYSSSNTAGSRPNDFYSSHSGSSSYGSSHTSGSSQPTSPSSGSYVYNPSSPSGSSYPSGQYPASGSHSTYPSGQYPVSGSHSTYPSSSGSQSVHYGYGQQSGYTYAPVAFIVTGDVPMELQQVSQTVHNDVARQLEIALTEQQRRYQQQHSYSSSYNPQEYQLALQSLTDELQRNLTKQLQQSINQHYGQQGQRGSYSYSVSGGSYGSSPNYNTQQLDAITQQLQQNLLQQLQQGLSSTYSSSSSSSSYNQGYTSGSYSSGGYSNPSYSHSGIKHLVAYGQFQGLSSDCDEMQGDDNFHREDTEKVESKHLYGGQTHRPYYGTQQIQEDDFLQQREKLQQQTQDDFLQQREKLQEGLTQQTEDDFFKQREKLEQLDLTQQTEDDLGKLAKLQGQEDLTQQTEDDLGQLQIGQQTEELRPLSQLRGDQQKPQEKPHETFHVSEPDVGRQNTYQTGYNRQQTTYGQTGQGTYQTGYGHSRTNKYDAQASDLTQQTENDRFLGQQQKEDLEDLSQQTENGFDKLQIGQQFQEPLGQQTQQTEDGFGQLIVGQSQFQPDLTQQTEDEFRQTQIGQNQYYGGGYSSSYNRHRHGHMLGQAQTSDSSNQNNMFAGQFQGADDSQRFQQVEQQNDLLMTNLQQYNQQHTQSGYGGDFGQVQQTVDQTYPAAEVQQVIVQNEQIDDGEGLTTTVEPGFWKRTGNKISNAYSSAKQTVGEWVDKAGTSLG